MKISEEVLQTLEGVDVEDISSVLQKWKEVNEKKLAYKQAEEILKNHCKAYLKEKGWERYKDDDSEISIILTQQKKEYPDMKILKETLTDAQWAQVIKITRFEKLTVVTPEARKRLKQYVKNV